MPRPTLDIEAAWNASAVTGLIVIGASEIGLTDQIGGAFAFTDFTDITEVQQVFITRGRTSDLSQMQAGTCRMILTDKTGKYNPLNPSSSLNGFLLPMRPIRIKVTHPITSTTYTIFYGFISSIEHNSDQNAEKTTIELIDLFEWLDKSFPTIAAQTDKTTGTLIGTILTEIGWTQLTLRDLSATGKNIPSFSASGTASALTLIQNLLTVDRGVFYIAGDGTATYLSHADLYKRQAAATTFTQTQAGAMRPSTQARLIVNGQSVTKTGNSAQTATDATSRKLYGQRDGTAIDSAYLNSDAQADSLARWIVVNSKDPTSPARPIKLMSEVDASATLTQMLSREIGDYVTLTDSVYGTNVSGFIEQITHEIDQGGFLMETMFLINKKNQTEITIGSSTIGSSDIMGY